MDFAGALAVAILAGSGSAGPARNAADNAEPAQVVELSDAEIADLLQRFIAVRKIPGIAVAIHDAKGSRTIRAGHVDLDRTTPVSDSTQFDLGSITKPLVATLAARLADEGRLRLDEPLVSVLLGAQPPVSASRITLEHLITHTSGLPRMPVTAGLVEGVVLHRRDPYSTISGNELRKFLQGWSPPEKLPAPFEYSNLGYAYLGQVIEARLQTPLFQPLQRYVLAPAGMHRATFAVTAQRAAGLSAAGLHAPAWDLAEFRAAGALRADARDMAALLRALVHAAPPFREADFEPRAARAEPDDKRRYVATGWMLSRRNDGTTVWHNGGTGGFRSWMGFHRERRVGVAVLANAEVSVDDLGLHLLDSKHKVGAPDRGLWDWFTLLVSVYLVLSLARPLISSQHRWGLRFTQPLAKTHVSLLVAERAAWLPFLFTAGWWLTWPQGSRYLLAIAAAALSLVLFARLRQRPDAGAMPRTAPGSTLWRAFVIALGVVMSLGAIR